jgi:MFS family permease
VIELGLLSCIVFQLGFGMAPSFTCALVFRFCMGAFNGIIGVSKAWLPELVSESRNAFAMSLLSGMWGVGQIIGPAIGGVLYRHNSQDGREGPPNNPEGLQPPPGDREGPSAVTTAAVPAAMQPQFAPNAVGVALATVALGAVHVGLPVGGGSGWFGGCSRSTCCLGRGPEARKALVDDDGAKQAAGAQGPQTSQHSDEHSQDTSRQRARMRAPAAPFARCCHACGVPRTALLPLLLYCLLSLNGIFYSEIYSLWCMAPREAGGLGWSSSQIGGLLSTGGAFLAASNFILFPVLARRFRITNLFRVCNAGLAIAYVLTPFIPHASEDDAVLFPLLVVHNACMQVLISSCFTASFLVTNNSCVRAQRGRVNGLGMSLGSGFKAAGPMLGSALFAWSLTNGLSAPFDVNFTFALCGGLALLTTIIAVCGLSPSNDSPLIEASKAAVELSQTSHSADRKAESGSCSWRASASASATTTTTSTSMSTSHALSGKNGDAAADNEDATRRQPGHQGC